MGDKPLDLKGLFVYVFVLILIIQNVIVPILIDLKNETFKLFLNPLFEIFLALFLILLGLVIFHLKKRRLAILEKQRLENEKYRKIEEIENKKRELLFKHLEPKQKVLPPFSSQTNDFDKQLNAKKIEINVDLRELFYKRKKLNEHEIEYLIKQGYQPFSYKSICTNKIEKYLLKPRFNESLNHMIVIYDLAEYLDKKSIDNNRFTTRMPDVVMYIKRKKIAFEVETGTVMTNMKKFKEKIALLNENYGDNWYFIVTNRNKIKRYKKYGKVIDLRYLKGQVDKIIKNARK